jgi:pimeloyl-ACP methyl ester carboxylesterase
MPLIETTDGTALYCKDWGEGPALVFLAGWGLSSDIWQYQLAVLSDLGLRCVAYDRRGHGRSDDPGRGFDYDTLADDLAAVLAARGLQDVTLVAHSMAGGEVVRYLTRHGSERVRGLVPVATALGMPRLPPEIGDAVRAVYASDFAGWARANAPAFVGAGLTGCDVSDELVDWAMRDMLRTSLRAILDCNHAMLETDLAAELGTIDVPALLIHGDTDASIPLEASSAVAVDLIPGARLSVYEDAPHGLMLSHRERFNEELLAFAKG